MGARRCTHASSLLQTQGIPVGRLQCSGFCLWGPGVRAKCWPSPKGLLAWRGQSLCKVVRPRSRKGAECAYHCHKDKLSCKTQTLNSVLSVWPSVVAFTRVAEVSCKAVDSAPAARAQSNNWWDEEDEEDQEELETAHQSAAQDALTMLEWPRVCLGVASFAETAVGKQRCLSLPLGSSPAESERLLAETSAALNVESKGGGDIFDFGGVETFVAAGAIRRAGKGALLSGPQLGAIAAVLAAGGRIRKGVLEAAEASSEAKGGWEVSAEPPEQVLVHFVENLVPRPEVVRAINAAVGEDGTVKDSASPELKRARFQVQSAESRLRELLGSISQNSGIVEVGGRLCMSIGANSETSVSGLLLGGSGAGAFSYIEPPSAVPLNNKLAEARQAASEAEQAVLRQLSNLIHPVASDASAALEAIVGLDVVLARSRFGATFSARRPTFINASEASFIVQLQQAKHPLLVLQAREALKRAKARAKSKATGVSRARQRGGFGANLEELEQEAREAATELQKLEDSEPVPIDLVVRAGNKVVAITGPNTGGKTAAIKTLGLAALMAKAGLFVLASEPAALPWFDAVLCDIGDDQSLVQSLSTFSGHLRRIQRIKNECTNQSLVLLDEVGGGTDPTEGAALGMALLQSFASDGAGGALLTMATTHHGELKTLKYTDPRFENASVEFDEEKLAPTYKLLWGIPGRSNALNIAERLGLDADIIAHARQGQGSASAEVNEAIFKLEQQRRVFDVSMAEAERLVQEAQRMSADLAAATRRLQQHRGPLLMQQADEIEKAAASARSQAAALVRDARTKIQVEQSIPEPSSPATSDPVESNTASTSGRDTISAKTGLPDIGEAVYVSKLGKEGTVVGLAKNGKEVTVMCGALQMKVKLKDLAGYGGSEVNGSSRSSRGAITAGSKSAVQARPQNGSGKSLMDITARRYADVESSVERTLSAVGSKKPGKVLKAGERRAEAPADEEEDLDYKPAAAPNAFEKLAGLKNRFR